MERKMIDAITYTDMLKHIRNNELIEDTIGILITRPDLHTGNDILKSLSYFHHLTGNNIISIYLVTVPIGAVIDIRIWTMSLLSMELSGHLAISPLLILLRILKKYQGGNILGKANYY